MLNYGTLRIQRRGFELQMPRENQPGGLLVQIRPPEALPGSLLNNRAGMEFLAQLAERWNACADALAMLDDGAESWEDASHIGRVRERLAAAVEGVA